MLSNNHQDLARIIPKKQFEATRAKIIHCISIRSAKSASTLNMMIDASESLLITKISTQPKLNHAFGHQQ
jgi:hypothetical protein